jgi:glucokinase
MGSGINIISHFKKIIAAFELHVNGRCVYTFEIHCKQAKVRMHISSCAILDGMDRYIAVDIGGTHIRAASYAADSVEPLQIARTETQNPDRTPLEGLINLIVKVWPDDGQVKSIGVAAPGPLDPFEGVIFKTPNIPEWDRVPISQILEDRFNIPAILGNDANLAALGEWKYGAGKGHHHLIYLTISTGIGGGVIVDDHLVLGHKGLASELGHVTVLPDGPLCSCGVRGHLEAVASGTGIARWVEEQLDNGVKSILISQKPITAKKVNQAAKDGDDLGLQAFSRAGKFIGHAAADFAHIFNPSIIIIGGGVSRSGSLLMDPLKASLKERVFSDLFLEGLEVTTAALGDEAGLSGALVLAQDRTNS